MMSHRVRNCRNYPFQIQLRDQVRAKPYELLAIHQGETQELKCA